MTDNEGIEFLDYKVKANCKVCALQNFNCCEKCICTVIKQTLDLINRRKAEIEKLQETKERLMYNLKAVLEEKADHTEAIKEFAERLMTDEMLHTIPANYGKAGGKVVIFAEDIDNLVKEMTEQRKEDEEK